MSNFNKQITETQVRLGEVRFSYAHVFEPTTSPNNDKLKYSVAILIPKADKQTVELCKKAIEAAKQAGKAKKWGGKIPATCKVPLRDGDEERPDDENYAGCYFFNASSERKPGVKVLEGKTLSDALGDEDFYSGCYGAVTINFYPFDQSGSKGVAAGLNNLVKTRDGERLSGGSSAEADFADLGDLAGVDDYLD